MPERDQEIARVTHLLDQLNRVQKEQQTRKVYQAYRKIKLKSRER